MTIYKLYNKNNKSSFSWKNGFYNKINLKVNAGYNKDKKFSLLKTLIFTYPYNVSL